MARQVLIRELPYELIIAKTLWLYAPLCSCSFFTPISGCRVITVLIYKSGLQAWIIGSFEGARANLELSLIHDGSESMSAIDNILGSASVAKIRASKTDEWLWELCVAFGCDSGSDIAALRVSKLVSIHTVRNSTNNERASQYIFNRDTIRIIFPLLAATFWLKMNHWTLS